jgi:two-component system OmpR family response regulator
MATAPTILLVDDDADIRRVAAISLERIGGFRVELASSGEEAIELAAANPPDLILLDVSMPGTDGPATLAALTALWDGARTERVPVVFFTAIANAEEVTRLRALGAVGVVGKPFDVMGLSARIRSILVEIGIG